MFRLVGFTYWNQLYSSYFHRNIYFLPLLIIIWTFCLFLSILHDLSHFSNTVICIKSFSFLLFLSTSFVTDIITSHLPFCFSFFLLVLSSSSLFSYFSSIPLPSPLLYFLLIFPSSDQFFLFFLAFPLSPLISLNFFFKSCFFWQKIYIYLFIYWRFVFRINTDGTSFIHIFFFSEHVYLLMHPESKQKMNICKTINFRPPTLFFFSFFLYIDMPHIFYQVSNMEGTCRK